MKKVLRVRFACRIIIVVVINLVTRIIFRKYFCVVGINYLLKIISKKIYGSKKESSKEKGYKEKGNKEEGWC